MKEARCDPYRISDDPAAKVVGEITEWIRKCANNTDPFIRDNSTIIKFARSLANQIEEKWGAYKT
jgi:hypothetical protein